MKYWALNIGFIWGVALFCCAAETQGRTVREALDVLLSTHYCGSAMLEGMGMGTALRGQSPISGDGFFDVPEEEWLPVLLEMVEEEMEFQKHDLAETIQGIRKWEAAGEIRDNSDDEGTRYLWDADKRIVSGRAKLEAMVVCLRNAEGGTEEVLNMLERVAKECPPEFDLIRTVNAAMADKACRDGEFKRCFELGQWYREHYGPGSRAELDICREFVRYGLPSLSKEADREEGYRYLLAFSETLNELVFAKDFDRFAQNAIPGWVGSLQRRRLAARFPDEPLPRVRYYNINTKESVDGGVNEAMVPLMLNRQAAAELAAEESDLTDLRQVYGDWAEERTHLRAYDSYSEWQLLPKGIDMEDETLVANFQQLKEQGKSAHEAMWAVLWNCPDLMPASAALDVLASTQDNQREVMEGLKQFLQERLPSAAGNEEWLVTEIAQILAEKGLDSDMEALIPMLSHPTARVRALGARYLGQRGGMEAIAALEAAKARNPVAWELKEIEAALLRIEERCSKPENTPETGETP